ncbi:MAG: hypothetical protein AAB352_02645 [Patescibacteria group bacterium]
MGYWDATDQIINANGGQNPICPACHQEMIPIDDHGRFSCACKPLFDRDIGYRLPTPIPMVIDRILDIERHRP